MTEPWDAPIEMFGSTFVPEVAGREVRVRELLVQRSGQAVPALVWLPVQAGAGPRPVVLIGHGAGGHKAAPIVSGLAERLTMLGLAAVSIDLPFHGDRTPPDEVGLSAAERRGRIGLQAWRERNQANEQAVADWRAALDAAQALPEVGRAPAGYIGLSLGSRSGLPLVAAEDRIEVAVLGLFGYSAANGPAGVPEAASGVTIPVLFLVQWDDELFPRDDGLALFDLIASEQKTLHANTGRHRDVPPAEIGLAVGFLARHLRPGAPSRPYHTGPPR